MMKRMMRRMLMGIAMMAVILAASQVVEAKADTHEIPCGAAVKAELNTSTKTLRIYGNGDMYDFPDYKSSPFREYASDIYIVKIEEGVTSIGAYSFDTTYWDYSSRIQSVSISSTVTRIGKSAFYDCNGLYDIDIPGNVKIIDTYAFAESNLNTCTLHEGLVEIGERAFYETNLTSIVIPDGVSSIEEYAFNTSSLKNVTIPKNIGLIASRAFNDVSADIYSKDVIIGQGAFGGDSTFTADRGSTADTYAKNHNLTIHYRSYPSTVTFNPNGGNVSQKTKKIYSESVYGPLPTPKRVGYAFKGWYTKASGGKCIKADTSVTTTQNSTLYAQWEKISVGKCGKPSITMNNGKEITLSLAKLTGATGYQIRYSTKSNMKSAKTTSGKITKTIKKLKAKKTYYIQVRAYKLDSAGKKVYGAWSGKKKVKVKK